ncbi:glycosyltransferase family 9 protein [Neolewinella aurantiaca]|uniref:Glycosyltransferase family 9 protein n=1 Tax=Neolewinella aurantiaca TaxID=2602767 RepID=A0A5C7FIK7_9BACT|nr:glycosyltransferase family 9 protein [Neolewinella aurantiaca]TXF90983.1 glycosyltransferase family 9 protein [Neolewinella aurantiaca]
MPQKVLIVRFSSIGDIVLTTPVIRCVKQQTDFEVHFLTKKSFAATLKGNPYIDRLWTIDKDISELSRTLLTEHYAWVLDLHGNLRTRELKTRLSLNALRHLRLRPKTRTFPKLNLQKFLLTRFGINRMPDVHIVDRYLQTGRDLGVVNDGKGLDYFISPNDEVDLLAEGLPPKYIAFVIGAAHATKRLTPPQMAEFCRNSRQPVILLGGPAEAETGEEIAAGLTHVYNACGRFNLGGSADLVRKASVVVSHDTGLMHIAAAFRKPIFSIWGNTVPDLGMYPYLPGTEALEKQRRQEVEGLSCRPCSKIGHQECPQGHFRCIMDQHPAAIASRVEEAYT